MPGIYIHIPFCRQACHYCDFHFSTSLGNKDALLHALKKEITLRKDYLGSKNISTVYFGGGTPSLLSQKEIGGIFEELYRHFHIEANAEITLEANPDDLTSAKVVELKSTPVNRLSTGIQSFSDRVLQWMNRSHTAADAIRSVSVSQDAGFGNITIDLIYGVPVREEGQWEQELDTAFSLGVQHLSAYCLTVEPRTALAHFIRSGSASNVNEEQGVQDFESLMRRAGEKSFVQYEISNFGKEGFFSRHNSAYWKGEHYLGLGPSAHSFNGTSRQWNARDNNAYIRSLKEGKPDFEKEVLTSGQRYNDYILTSLRTMWGTDLEHVAGHFGPGYREYCEAEAKRYISSSLLVQKENKLFLTDKGKLLADKIASDLFRV